MSTDARLEQLRRDRPRSRFLTFSIAVLSALAAYSWCSGAIDFTGLFSDRRRTNLERFLTEDIVPPVVREGGLGELPGWAQSVLLEHGYQAALATISISLLAIVLAAILSWCFAPLAAASLATRRPFESDPSEESLGWRYLRLTVRLLLILLRSIPEYILAFLLLTVLGPQTAWPAVLALALHNAGILGRLGADTIENLDPGPLRSLQAIGARRRGILLAGVFPLALGRYLLYFFYRFETCVREATVLGMLGVVSLGYWIQDARAKQFYDEMLLLVGVGVVIVFLADISSALARKYLREQA